MATEVIQRLNRCVRAAARQSALNVRFLSLQPRRPRLLDVHRVCRRTIPVQIPVVFDV